MLGVLALPVGYFALLNCSESFIHVGIVCCSWVAPHVFLWREQRSTWIGSRPSLLSLSAVEPRPPSTPPPTHLSDLSESLGRSSHQIIESNYPIKGQTSEPDIIYHGLAVLVSQSSELQELCESRDGRPGFSVLTSLMVSVDVKQYWNMLTHWSLICQPTSLVIKHHLKEVVSQSSELQELCESRVGRPVQTWWFLWT